MNKRKINLNNWIDNGFHGSMDWIKTEKMKKINIFQYYPNAKSVISVSINYFSGHSKRLLFKS